MNRHKKNDLLKNLHYFELVKDQMEKHELKAKSIQFRKNLLERQRVANYTNELDRVRGLLSRTVLPGQTRVGLTERARHLRTLGAQATGSIS